MSSASGTPSLPITTHTPSSDNAPDSDGHIPTSPSLPPTPSTNGVDPLQRPEKTLDSSPLQRSSLSNQPEQVIANGHLEPQTESMLEETMLSVTSTDTSILSDQTTPTPALHTEHHTQNYAPRAPSTPPQARASLFGNAASLVARTLGSFTPTFKRTPQQLPASQPAKVLTSIDTTMEDVEQSPASSISRHVNGQPSHGFPRRQPSTPYPKRKLTRIANEPEIDPWESTKNDLHHRTSVRTTRKQMADHLFQQFMKLKPSKKDKELLQEILKELHQRAIGDTIDEMNNAGLSFRMRDRDIGTEAEYLNTERRLVRHLKPIEEEEIPRIVKQYIDAIISEKQDEFYWDERTGTVVQKELVLATPIATKPNSILRRTATPGKRLVKISELSAIPNPKDGFGMDERYFDTDDSLVEQSDYSDPMPKTSKRKRVNVNTLKQIPNPKGGFGMNDKYFGDNSMVTVSDNSTMTPPVKKARLGQSTAKSVRFFSPKSGKIRRTTQTPSTVADMSAYTASTPTPGYSWPTPGTPGYRHTWDRPQEEPSSSENVFTGSPTGRELAPYNPGDGVNEDASDLAEWSPTEKKKFLKTGHVSGSGSFCVPEGDAEDSSMLDATISEYDEHATPGTPEQPMYANQTQLPSTLSAPKPQANGVSTKVSVTPTTDAKATTTPKSAAQIDSSAIILREEEIDTEDTESVDALDGISTDGSDFDIEDYYDGAGPLSPTDSDDAITPEEWWDIVTGGLDHLKKPNAAEEEAIEKARRNAEKFKPAKGSALRNVSKGDEDDDSDIGIDEDDAYDRAVIKRLMGLFDTDGEEIEDKQLTPKKYVKVMDAVKKHLPELELESD
ncbi:hypothetical protein P152DRAFT_150038 [Eremomyces bilateralis CBS 781.70]|uniref:Uncharacterized protein n=1 Tax=Eremomyces bilateralis CBS 781.70 TaxID=1392243 RepID=A0A6G1FVR0_9PEZI|nr:uncharacterized protein P152DRAFT_150038 [Eremomyces bilateralis CBS 781.70]KAF1809790.1 hypothetical protein P152DRAFT_150038 [Eremomyces bilateralis CBS 781.70]